MAITRAATKHQFEYDADIFSDADIDFSIDITGPPNMQI
jgi:hypothetical protein